jgi:hypothetical protein
MITIPEIPEVERPVQLPPIFLWSLQVPGVDKNTAYTATIKAYPWLDRLTVAWVKSIKCLYFATDYNGDRPVDPRKGPASE